MFKVAIIHYQNLVKSCEIGDLEFSGSAAELKSMVEGIFSRTWIGQLAFVLAASAGTISSYEINDSLLFGLVKKYPFRQWRSADIAEANE
jgi:hypothetical protein